MKTYKIIYHEIVSHIFYVDADNKDEAEEKFEAMAYNGELDYSDGEVIDTETKIYENQKEKKL